MSTTVTMRILGNRPARKSGTLSAHGRLLARQGVCIQHYFRTQGSQAGIIAQTEGRSLQTKRECAGAGVN